MQVPDKLRIGFTGAQGTGKTSVSDWLADQLPDQIVRVPSTARLLAENGYKINRDAGQFDQLLTTVTRINIENEYYDAAPAGSIVVSDRTPVDSLAYTSYQFSKFWEQEPVFYLTQTYKMVSQHMIKYDAVFYFPPYFDPEEDGLRDTDPEWQKDIDSFIRSSLFSLSVPVVLIGNTVVAARGEVVMKRLSELTR